MYGQVGYFFPGCCQRIWPDQSSPRRCGSQWVGMTAGIYVGRPGCHQSRGVDLPSESAVQSLEDTVQRALRSLDTSKLTILGYGEVTTVFRLDTDDAAFACKRFPVFQSSRDAQSHQALIVRYVAALEERGVRVLDTGFVPLPTAGDATVLYLVQPMVDPDRIGPRYFATLGADEVRKRFRDVAHAVRQSVSPTLAVDGQLSNWIFFDDGLTCMDISTPLMRSPSGDDLCNWQLLSESALGGLLRPARGYFNKKIPETVASYYSLRGQALDFLGNLRKEKLDHLVEPLIPIANEAFELDDPIALEDVKKYYNEDADFYALAMKAMRINRFFYRTILRKTYPNFIAPTIDRNKF